MGGFFFQVGGAILFFLLLLAPARAQSPAPATAFGPPDVLLLVFAVPGGADQIGLTYASKVPHAQVQRDLAALRQNTGWALSGVKITDGPASLGGRRGALTAAECVTPGAVDVTAHTLPVEPVVRAFRAYKNMTLTYFVPVGFQFQGMRDFADNHVRIALQQHGGTYTYRVSVRDPNFDHLALPRYGLPASDAQSASAARGTRRRPNPFLVGLTLAAALGAGGVVYILLARGGR